MRAFAKIHAYFWLSPQLKGIGQRYVALYLLSSPHRNMLGIYYLPLPYIAADTQMSLEEIRVIIKQLCVIGYCHYDECSQYIWICDMAAGQIGIQLDAKDKMVKGINAIWESLPPFIPFLEEFYQKYHSSFYLTQQPKHVTTHPFESKYEGASQELNGFYEAPSKGLSLKHQAPFAPFSSETVFGQNQEKNDEVNDTQASSNSTEQKASNLPYPIENQALITHSQAPSKSLAQKVEAPPCRIENREEEKERKEKREEEKKEINNLINLEGTTNIVEQKQNVAQARPNEHEIFVDKFSIQQKNETKPCDDDRTKPSNCGDNGNTESTAQKKTSSQKNKKHAAVNAMLSKQVIQVFEHWKSVMQHPKSNLDEKRKALIRKALQLGYSDEQLCNAITGCSYTPHNIGQNDRGQRYDGLHVILRDADQIDRFIHNYRAPPQPFNSAHQRLHDNLRVVDNWVNNMRTGKED